MTPEDHADILRDAVRLHVPGGGEQHLEALLELGSPQWTIQPVYDADTSGWQLEHDCGWCSNLQDQARSLQDLARWIGNHGCTDDEVSAGDTAPPEPNKPTGFTVRKPWNQIPVGWFVRAPKGVWYEVTLNRFEFESGRQVVELCRDGVARSWPRDPDEPVTCRRGSLASQAQAAAMEALGEGATILQDGVE
jgi:hypothetical protein